MGNLQQLRAYVGEGDPRKSVERITSILEKLLVSGGESLAAGLPDFLASILRGEDGGWITVRELIETGVSENFRLTGPPGEPALLVRSSGVRVRDIRKLGRKVLEAHEGVEGMPAPPPSPAATPRTEKPCPRSGDAFVMAEEGLSAYGSGRSGAFEGGGKPAGCIELNGCDPAVLYAILARCDPGHAWEQAIEIARIILRDALWLYRLSDPFVRALSDLSPQLYEGAGREWSETFDFNHHPRSAPECARMVEGLAGLARVARERAQSVFIFTSIDNW